MPPRDARENVKKLYVSEIINKNTPNKYVKTSRSERMPISET